MRDVRKMQSNNQFGYSWDRIIVEKRDRIIVEGDAKICIDSLAAMSSKGKQVHWSISTLIRNSLEISKNFWVVDFVGLVETVMVQLMLLLSWLVVLEGPFLVINPTSQLLLLIFARLIGLLLWWGKKSPNIGPDDLGLMGQY